MVQSDYDLLVEMGFDPQRAKLAANKTKGLQDAIDWLEKTQDMPIDELLQTSSASQAVGDTDEKDEDGDRKEISGTAASLKCTDCGKLFSSPERAQFHASRTEHSNFEESTEVIQPLTEEEKKAKLTELQQKLAEKRAAEKIAEQKERQKNEAIRRKKTQDTETLKEELRRKEQLKEVEARKAEKLADAQAKERVRQQIRETQEARRREAERAKAAREGRALPEEAPVAAPKPEVKKPTVNHAEARLQLRLTGQAPLIVTVPAETTLFEVAQQVEHERGIPVNSFTMTFPRKTFDKTEFGVTVKDAKWVPSCALVVA
ncbi:hypothetical protein EX30DRAFT_60153 [Ascodesmis nigricans]|uniref:C2H2-type domain-containing protein n=1 Tax=Ascodesmis nigricans TaxID=341454 RepID=A0A4S2MV78_9PEZI|nr:hypothetical protein EX30DRAFT_60153 [Ascodesmis nigricans]